MYAPYGYSYNPFRNPLAWPWILGGLALGTAASVAVIVWHKKARAAELVAKLPTVTLPPGPPAPEEPAAKIPLVRTNVVLKGTGALAENRFVLAAPSPAVVTLSPDGHDLVVKAPADVLVSFPAGPNLPEGLKMSPGVNILQGKILPGSPMPLDYVLRFSSPTPADADPVMFTVGKGPGEGEFVGGSDFLRISAV